MPGFPGSAAAGALELVRSCSGYGQGGRKNVRIPRGSRSVAGANSFVRKFSCKRHAFLSAASVVAAMNFHVLVVGYGSDQAEHVFAAIRLKAVEENGIRGGVLARELEFGIAYDDFTLIVDAKLTAHL